MDRVQEIEDASKGLTPDEYRRLAGWFLEREHDLWDNQMDQDSSSGKLDPLFAEAEHESVQELLREWPPKK